MTPSAVLAGEALWAVLEGDCVTLDLPLGSLDAAVMDPPAGIGFMGKDWDHHKGGRAEWIAWMTARMRVAFALLKPGGHAVIWALPRTSHWTATAIEDAGFEIRDVLTHHFGSGFPKSLDVSKAIDSAAGAGSVSGIGENVDRVALNYGGATGKAKNGLKKEWTITAPATPEAAQWEGWGTALKPSSEHWILARKPLIGTVAANVLAHGTGGLNVDACRVASGPIPTFTASHTDRFIDRAEGVKIARTGDTRMNGRWPTNTVFSHGEGCGDDCAEGCPVAELDRQSGTLTSGSRAEGVRSGRGYGSTSTGDGGPAIEASSGGASRFFPTFQYVPKAPRSMREAGLVAAEGERANDHPTVKHDDLMRWLVRLVTPPGGVVLDMFMGSGSTGRGAILEGCRFIGIDAEAHYVEIAKARIKDAEPKPERQLRLF